MKKTARLGAAVVLSGSGVSRYIGGMNINILLALFCAVLLLALFAAPQMVILWQVLAIAAAIIAYAVCRTRR